MCRWISVFSMFDDSCVFTVLPDMIESLFASRMCFLDTHAPDLYTHMWKCNAHMQTCPRSEYLSRSMDVSYFLNGFHMHTQTHVPLH